jgi:membrane dipeptidase
VTEAERQSRRSYPARRAPAIADAHNDLLVEVAYFAAEPHPFRERWLRQLREGGVALQVCPVSVGIEELPERGLRTALGQAAACHRAVADDPNELVLVKEGRDLREAMADGRTGLMLSMEGAEPLGYDPTQLDVFWLLGVRMLALTWNRRNPFADGLGEAGDGGLSHLGRALVERAAGLGMIMDLAHASERTFFEVLELASDAPVVVSHAGCRGAYDTPRNLSDEQLAALKERGGVLGLMAHPLSVDLGSPSLERFLDHVDYAVGAMGAEHVGLGVDFMAQIVASGAEPALQATSLLPPGRSFAESIPGLVGPADYPALAEALAHRGYDGDTLAAILGGNLIRLVSSALT